jgi:hypothetical protein
MLVSFRLQVGFLREAEASVVLTHGRGFSFSGRLYGGRICSLLI